MAPTKTSKPKTAKEVGLRKGFRSGLEDVVAAQIEAVTGLPVSYETFKINYVKPERKAKYTPDFRLPNGIIIETKGKFETEDRQKHLLIRAQHPEFDIRFVFSNSRSRIRKGSPTTYAKWCEDNGFRYADKRIPESWFNEPVPHT